MSCHCVRTRHEKQHLQLLEWMSPDIRYTDTAGNDIEYSNFVVKVKSINETLSADLSSAMKTYMNSIDSITTKLVTNTES